jgi:ATP-dependent protease ClpP protease subunit
MNKLLLITLLLSCDCAAGTKVVQPTKADVSAEWLHLQLIGRIDQQSTELLIKVFETAPAGVVKGITLEINSGGGVADSAFLLSKAIENSKVPVVCVVDGHGMSAAFYVLQSCTYRVMTKRSVLMTHNPSISGVGGNAGEFLEVSRLLAASQEAMLQHTARRLVIPVKQLREWLSTGALFMDYTFAIKIGAVDLVVDSVLEYFVTLR